MLKHRPYHKMGQSNLGWLKSHFHFSFADYYNPNNMNFGVLRVINDDYINPNTGFDMHPHRDMEIITYVLDGHLTHHDSLGNGHRLGRGEVQYMSAGTGIFHSEHNLDQQIAHLLQIWIVPQARNLKPNYGDFAFKLEDRYNQWLYLVGHTTSQAPIKIYQDINMYATIIDRDHPITFDVKVNRQAYLVVAQGNCTINTLNLTMGDGLEIIEEMISISTQDQVHILVIEMAKT